MQGMLNLISIKFSDMVPETIWLYGENDDYSVNDDRSFWYIYRSCESVFMEARGSSSVWRQNFRYYIALYAEESLKHSTVILRSGWYASRFCSAHIYFYVVPFFAGFSAIFSHVPILRSYRAGKSVLVAFINSKYRIS
jgi:hypothetical protein